MAAMERTARRHHPGHSTMKKNCSRKMRRRSKQLLYMGQEPLVKMPAIANKCWCCGNHQDDWRY